MCIRDSYYTSDDQELSIEEYMAGIIHTAENTARELGIALPRLTVEPGRSIINEAGLTLYRVGGTKVIADVRKYVFEMCIRDSILSYHAASRGLQASYASPVSTGIVTSFP